MPPVLQALALRQDFPEAFANLVHSLQCVCEWADRPALFKRCVGGRAGWAAACGMQLGCVVHSKQSDAAL